MTLLGHSQGRIICLLLISLLLLSLMSIFKLHLIDFFATNCIIFILLPCGKDILQNKSTFLNSLYEVSLLQFENPDFS